MIGLALRTTPAGTDLPVSGFLLTTFLRIPAPDATTDLMRAHTLLALALTESHALNALLRSLLNGKANTLIADFAIAFIPSHARTAAPLIRVQLLHAASVNRWKGACRNAPTPTPAPLTAAQPPDTTDFTPDHVRPASETPVETVLKEHFRQYSQSL